MASSLVQIRLDDDLKAQASALYDALGLDLPTAMVNGIPFSMTLPANEYKATRAFRAMQEISEAASAAGVSDMTLDEINAEIDAARDGQKA